MSQIHPLSTHHDTGLSDSTHTSTSSSARKYALDEDDTRPILLYRYRGGLKTSSQKDLCALLDKDEKLRVTKKEIPRYTSYVDVKRHDLYTQQEKKLYSTYPNYDSNLASIKVPSLAYWMRLLFGSYQELYIVSPETSPSSSQNESQVDEDSRRASPTSTWPREDGEEERMGRIDENDDGSG